MTRMGIHTELINIIKSQYDYISSSILLTNPIGIYFPMAVCVRQGCLLFPIFYDSLF